METPGQDPVLLDYLRIPILSSRRRGPPHPRTVSSRHSCVFTPPDELPTPRGAVRPVRSSRRLRVVDPFDISLKDPRFPGRKEGLRCKDHSYHPLSVQSLPRTQTSFVHHPSRHFDPGKPPLLLSRIGRGGQEMERGGRTPGGEVESLTPSGDRHRSGRLEG